MKGCPHHMFILPFICSLVSNNGCFWSFSLLLDFEEDRALGWMFYLLAFYFPVIEVTDRIKTFCRSLFFQLFFLIPLTSVVSVSATNLIGWRGLYCMRKWYLQVLSGAWHSGKNSLSLTSAMRNGPCCMIDYTNRLKWFCQAAERCYFFLSRLLSAFKLSI